MDTQGILFLLSTFLLIPHGVLSTGRSLQQGDCSECGPGCRVRQFLIGGDNLFRPEPFMASLRQSTGNNRVQAGDHRCGGTLIAPNVVLTAAHCIVEGSGRPLTPKVHVGRFARNICDGVDFEVFRTRRSIVHPQYSQTTADNDIALLVLDSSSSRTPIKLASSDSCFESRGGCRVRLLGWGDTTSGGAVDLSTVLQEAFTTSVSRSTCEAQPVTITRNMICAGEPEGGIDSCGGDSGGPMILESGEQVGIVSFGIGIGCARPDTPGVYASVPRLLGWIQDELDKLSGSSLGACDCARFGVSGGVNTGRFGCARHLADRGDSDRFCMVRGGTRCSSATESGPFPGAAWKDC